MKPSQLTDEELAKIKSADPKTALRLITEKRTQGTLLEFLRVRMEKENFQSRPFFRRLFRSQPLLHPVTEQMFQPVNPLLVCTCLAFIRSQNLTAKTKNILNNFTAGLSVPSLENEFLSIEEQEPSVLINIVTEENKLVSALEEIGLEVLLEEGPVKMDRVANVVSKWDAPFLKVGLSYKFGNQHTKSKKNWESSGASEIQRAQKK